MELEKVHWGCIYTNNMQFGLVKRRIGTTEYISSQVTLLTIYIYDWIRNKWRTRIIRWLYFFTQVYLMGSLKLRANIYETCRTPIWTNALLTFWGRVIERNESFFYSFNVLYKSLASLKRLICYFAKVVAILKMFRPSKVEKKKKTKMCNFTKAADICTIPNAKK